MVRPPDIRDFSSFQDSVSGKNLIPCDHDIQYIIISSRPIGLVFGFPKSGLDFHCGRVLEEMLL